MNPEKNDLEFSPTFEELIEQLDGLIEHIVQGCAEIRRVEEHLFQLEEGLDVEDISIMQIDEQPVDDAKSRVEQVIRKNTSGPERWVSCISAWYTDFFLPPTYYTG